MERVSCWYKDTNVCKLNISRLQISSHCFWIQYWQWTVGGKFISIPIINNTHIQFSSIYCLKKTGSYVNYSEVKAIIKLSSKEFLWLTYFSYFKNFHAVSQWTLYIKDAFRYHSQYHRRKTYHTVSSSCLFKSYY